MSVKEKATAPVSSVGADGKQPLINNNKEIIADLPTQDNLQATNKLLFTVFYPIFTFT